MDISNEAIGKRIRETRWERGYTIEELAEYAEVSANFLGAVETGQKSMKVQNMAKIAAALGVTTDYLITGNSPYKENAKINGMIAALSDSNRKQLEKMIALFSDTFRINDSDNRS